VRPLASLQTEAAAILADLQRGAGTVQELRRQAEVAEKAAETVSAEVQTLDEVVSLLQAMQSVWTKRFEEAVGKVVSRGLNAVFGEALDLVVEMGAVGDLPTARFSVRDSRGLETDVMDARGGGLVNVAAFLLRVLLLLSARPQLSRILVLDETFANVSAEYVPALVELLRRIVDEGGFQVLLVTHRPELAEVADIAYRFHLQDGTTVVSSVTRSSAESL